jgi:hypothetical protein
MWEVRRRSNNAVIFSAPSQAECVSWLGDQGMLVERPTKGQKTGIVRDYQLVDTRLEEGSKPVFRTSVTPTPEEPPQS